MPTRRMIMTGAAALLLMSSSPVRYARAQTGDEAVAFVRNTADQLVAVVDSTGSPQEKRLRLLAVLDKCIDVDGIARFSLGHFWHLGTPDQQKQYTALFRELLATQIANHFGEYQGVRVTVGLARAGKNTEIVVTMVERPNAETRQVDWVVSTATGTPKIVDLLSGGVSMRLSQSSDFASYLARHQYNIDDLIGAMRHLIGPIR